MMHVGGDDGDLGSRECIICLSAPRKCGLLVSLCERVCVCLLAYVQACVWLGISFISMVLFFL